MRLFEDEAVLSGDGRLEPSQYKFQFRLEFPKEDSPHLPSSLDFERGTISYVITAILTQPAISGPATVMSCDASLSFMEKVDISNVEPLSDAQIFVEPISRRRKKKLGTAHDKLPAIPDPAILDLNDPDLARNADGSVRHVEVPVDDNSSIDDYVARPAPHSSAWSSMQSDLRSEVSAETALSTGSTARSTRSMETYQAPETSPVDDRTIIVTIEPLQSGCLPGDILKFKVWIQHVRPMRNIHGVIVTFFRSGRIDYSRPVDCYNVKDDPPRSRRRDREHSYPKSKIGLSGMSISSADGTNAFRKELSQTFSPVHIDSNTLSSSFIAYVRVPADVFPTITDVPGDILSFTYHVELLLDLGGKLSSQLSGGQGNFSQGRFETSNSIFETSQARRMKGVITQDFEIVVGTVDSSRKARNGFLPHRTHDTDPFTHSSFHGQHYLSNVTSGLGQRDHMQGPPGYTATPSRAIEAGVSEKEQLRLAEERYLPSEPPNQVGGSLNEGVPTAPSRNSSDGVAYPSSEMAVISPSAPPLSHYNPALSPLVATSDKQELERQRLFAQASAPTENSNGQLPSAPAENTLMEVSAPQVTDHNIESNQSDHHCTDPSVPEPLPRYER